MNLISFISPLRLHNFEIPTRLSVKLLDMYFHQKLTWVHEIKILEATYLRALNILKFTSHPSKGCKRKLLDYNYVKVSSALNWTKICNLPRNSVLALLDPIQSSDLRLTCGAYQTNHKLSLCGSC